MPALRARACAFLRVPPIEIQTTVGHLINELFVNGNTLDGSVSSVPEASALVMAGIAMMTYLAGSGLRRWRAVRTPRQLIAERERLQGGRYQGAQSSGSNSSKNRSTFHFIPPRAGDNLGRRRPSAVGTLKTRRLLIVLFFLALDIPFPALASEIRDALSP